MRVCTRRVSSGDLTFGRWLENASMACLEEVWVKIRTFASGASEFFFGHCVVTLLEPPIKLKILWHSGRTPFFWR